MLYRIGPRVIIVVSGSLVGIYILAHEVGLGAIVLASIRADQRADPAYGWLMRSTGEAQTAMRRVLGFVNISELKSAVGARIRFLLAGRLRRVDK